MDNYFQKIYRPVLRLAEKTDTRAAIQRHQRQWAQSDDGKDKKDKDGRMFGDDVMSVSLAALVNLLEDLLAQSQNTVQQSEEDKSNAETQQTDKDPDAGEEHSARLKPSPVEQANSAAAQAYQHAAETRDSDYPSQMKPSDSAGSGDYASGIPPEEIDTERVQRLLKKARKLQKAGYEDLKINDRGDFLKSLEYTIEKTLEG